MSFHHAPLGKGSPPGDVEPLGTATERSDSNPPQTASAETAKNKNQVDVAENYDDEARFELLSAYLDNEVTPQERQLVSQWLMEDPNTLQMYRRLLILRQAIRTAPVTPSVTRTLEIPTPPQPALLPSSTLQRTVILAVAIALIVCLGQIGTVAGQQQVQTAWQLIKSLPQNLLPESASEIVNPPHQHP